MEEAKFRYLGDKYKDDLTRVPSTIGRMLDACLLAEILEQLKIMNENFESMNQTKTITKNKK